MTFAWHIPFLLLFLLYFAAIYEITSIFLDVPLRHFFLKVI